MKEVCRDSGAVLDSKTSDGELYAKVSNVELVNELTEIQDTVNKLVARELELREKYDKAIAFVKKVERTPLLYTTLDAQALELLSEIGEDADE